MWHWFLNVTGTRPSSSVLWYNFWSGFGSDLGEGTILVAVIGGYRHVNCHVKGCVRIGRHEYDMNGVKYKLCRKHHPAVDEANRPTAQDFEEHFHSSR